LGLLESQEITEIISAYSKFTYLKALFAIGRSLPAMKKDDYESCISTCQSAIDRLRPNLPPGVA